MSDRKLRRRCRALLRELDIRPPLEVRELCARLADRRGRPIRLVAHPIKVPGPFGLWFMTQSMDVIFYQRGARGDDQAAGVRSLDRCVGR